MTPSTALCTTNAVATLATNAAPITIASIFLAHSFFGSYVPPEFSLCETKGGMRLIHRIAAAHTAYKIFFR